MRVMRRFFAILAAVVLVVCGLGVADEVPRRPVEGQPLAANAGRVLDSLKMLGAPFSSEITAQLQVAIRDEDSKALQDLLDTLVMFVAEINPELRVKVKRGPGDAVLQQGGFTPVLIKVLNDATLARSLRLTSPQAGAVYSGAAEGILIRQAQLELKANENTTAAHRFLDVEVLTAPPMTPRLSGLSVEYVLALIHSSESGTREATLVFDVGEGTQDLGFRSEVPVLFSIRPAIPVRLSILDSDEKPTTARLEFRDQQGRVYPPQAKRLAPDFFFQPQIYRKDGDVVLLPPGSFVMESSRGPEYVRQIREITISEDKDQVLDVRLQRWIDPSDFGYYSGDHHIHAAGCSHYDNPTQGVTPADMFSQVKGEGLNVGCVLTWGPCFDHQRTFFSPIADTVSEAKTVLKYDLEISGFGSAALGHVCLLNLQDQTYPGSQGSSTKGWPTWTVPVMRWAKEQGGVTGYPHSALHANAKQTAEWIIEQYDANGDGLLNPDEAAGRLLPASFPQIEADRDGLLSLAEIQSAADTAADQLPNLTLPSMDGGGAMEIFVSTSEGVCDFISAMDTARIPEWNTWYHLLNCGFPLKLSGETDFPCMSSRRVGQGRVYVQLGKVDQLDFTEWCQAIAWGRSYVSDGYAHAVDFRVNDLPAGTADVKLDEPGLVIVEACVVFASEQPRAVAYGTLEPPGGKRVVGDTINLHAPRDSGFVTGGERLVELIMNGEVVAKQGVPADGKPHDVRFRVPVNSSSWLAIRQFPQMHTNPVNVIVGEKSIRASRASALWCADSIRLLWRNRRRFISESERSDAAIAYKRSLENFLTRAAESVQDDGLITPAATLEP